MKFKAATRKLKNAFASAVTRRTWELMKEMGTHPEFALPGESVRSDKKMLDLIAAGVDLNCRDKNGWTLLMRASFYGCKAAVPALLEKGADVLARETNVDPPHFANQSAIILASMKGHAEVVVMLAKAGANPNDKDKSGLTPLHYAWDADAVDALMHAGADLEARDAWGFTPLLRQAQGEIPDGLEAMLKWGARLDAKDNGGFTALHYAKESRHEAIRTLVAKAYNADAAEKLPVVQESFSVKKKPLAFKPKTIREFMR